MADKNNTYARDVDQVFALEDELARINLLGEEESGRVALPNSLENICAISNLPAELLVEIFSYQSSMKSSVPRYEVMRADLERARGPFRVSAVSRRWRDIALGAPRLWHFVTIDSLGLDDRPGQATKLLCYIETVLQRSRGTVIDIVFGEISDVCATEYKQLLNAVAPARDRWRRFCAVIQGSDVCTHVLDLLSAPTPKLRTLMISSQEDFETWSYNPGPIQARPPASPILPEAPALRWITLVNMPIIALDHALTNYPILETFQCSTEHLHVPALLKFLRTLSQVRSLTLVAASLRYGPVGEENLGPADLPNLGWLSLLEPAAAMLLPLLLDSLRMPQLASITIADCSPASVEPSLQSLRAQLTSVAWRYVELKDVDIAILASLETLKYADFSYCTVPASMISCLSGISTSVETLITAVMWPCLELLRLHGSKVGDVSAGRLVELARMRNARPTPVDSKGRACWATPFLIEVTGKNHDIPREQMDEILMINLASQN